LERHYQQLAAQRKFPPLPVAPAVTGRAFTRGMAAAAAAAGANGRDKGDSEDEEEEYSEASGPRRWWNLLLPVANILNDQEIVVDKKRLGYTPAEVNEDNLPDFLEALYKAAPAYKVAQYNIDPAHVQFAYTVGTYVRSKLIVTSSKVIGEKHSETNLGDAVYRIAETIANVTKRMTAGKQYRCINIRSGEEEIFDENDIVPTNPNVTTGDRHVPISTAHF